MKHIDTFKASDWSEDNKIEPLQVTFTQEVPEMRHGTLGFDYYFREVYSAEGKKIVDALLEHAPGGLVDAIFAHLALHKARIFRVADEGRP